jgi:arylsulfatase A-like enzyme
MVDAFGISGCHRMHGVLIANGGAVKPETRAAAARIVDVTPTLLYLMGQPLPGDMDGQVLTEMISAQYLDANPIRLTSEPSADQTTQVEFLPEENEEIIERLKSLGYIG